MNYSFSHFVLGCCLVKTQHSFNRSHAVLSQRWVACMTHIVLTRLDWVKCFSVSFQLSYCLKMTL